MSCLGGGATWAVGLNAPSVLQLNLPPTITVHVYVCTHPPPCRQRKGLVPVLVVSSLILLVLLIAVVRAAASAHEDQRGVICFLSKLGVQIGGGCSSSSSSTSQLMSAGASKAAVSKVLGELVEATPRVRDIEPHIPTGASILKADGTVVAAAAGAAANANATDGGAQLGMRLLRAWWLP